MADATPQIVPFWFLAVMALVLWLCVAVWLVVAARLRRALPVLPYQGRCPVPWRGLDLLVVLAVYLAMGILAIGLISRLLPEEITREPAVIDLDQASTQHMVARLLKEADGRILLLCALATVVVAPITEEFLFRVLLQGYLEAGQRRLRPQMPTLRRLFPGGAGPILIVSFVFAMIHFRVETPMRHPTYLATLVVANSVASLATVAFAIGYLRFRARATAADLGWVPEKFLADVVTGLVAFAAVAAPIYGLQIFLVWLLPKYFAADPFPLFFLAIALGILYRRTHRIVPAVVLHMALNAASLSMAWLALGR